MPRLDENETVLVQTYELVTAAVVAKRRIAPASEWLLDNFYLIEEQIRTARRHLPKAYSRELPRLLNGPRAGYPRSYDIVLELIAHVDGRVDAAGLRSFVAAYQTVAPLSLGELWAIPIMLRLALIENLRRIAVRIAADKRDRNNANHWADRLTKVAEEDPRSLILVLADMARSQPPTSSAFIAELARRLQGQGPALAFPLTWVEQRLSEEGQTIERLVQAEGQRQAADQVSIGNSIGSLRILGATDWREFVEAMSLVDQVLRKDPAGIYAAMDFATRDLYRHAVEEVARRSPLSQTEVAECAVALRRRGRRRGLGRRRPGASHVGFYLIGKGRPQFERAAQYRQSLGAWIREVGRRFPLGLYLGAILALDGCARGGRPRPGASVRVSAMGHGGGRDPARPGREPARRHPGELARDDADRAETAAEAGFLPEACRRRCGPWLPCRRCLSASETSTTCSKGWRCATWPIATTTCTSRS